MVRADNIRVAEHLANFCCDACGTTQTDVNVNTQLSYNERQTSIIVPCTNGSCGSVSYYPTSGGDETSCQLAEAKTQ
jgi:RNase P subunit RPR2